MRKLRFKAHSPGCKLLIDQLRDFPIGEHDDGPDALEQMFRMLIYLASGRGQDNEPIYLRP
jgi:hypothetical protein